MDRLRILISGGGIAGLTAAHFLAKAGAHITIVERSPSLRAAGQGVDVTGPGRAVLRYMDIEETVKANTTKELGARLVDTNNHAFAEFLVDPTGQDNFSPTREIEISRGKLIALLYDKTKLQNNIEHVFDEYITAVHQQEGSGKARVEFSNGKAAEQYDLVIAADGQGSRTRRLVWGEEASKAAVRSLHAWAAYFTIPATPEDGSISRIYFTTGRRWLWIRPLGDDKVSSAYINIATRWDPAFEKELGAAKNPLQQKALIRKRFEGAGWETERVLKGMDECDDFYLQDVAQIKLDNWTKGAVVLLGDAACCPSPVSGVGATAAFIASYILAGEIARQPDNLPAALAKYEETFRPYIEKKQYIPPGIPWAILPQTWVGLAIQRNLARFASWVAKTRLGQWLASGEPSQDAFKLPEYAELLGQSSIP